MANFIYNEAKYALANKTLDLDTDASELLLVMTNTTANTEYEKTALSGFTTLDEFNGANYARKAVTTAALTRVTGASGYTKLTCDAFTFAALGAGTRQAKAAILARTSDHLPIAYIDTVAGGSPTTFPFTADSNDIIITPSSFGLLQVVQGTPITS